MIIVGIDPDSARMGFAVYFNKKLIICTTTDIPELITFHLPALQIQQCTISFSIENVLAQNFVYARNVKKTKGAQGAVSNSIGRCQQNQAELMRWLDRLEIPYILHKPTGDNWADNRPFFERITGWRFESNRDGRSAAYFGWLEAK